MRQFTLDCLKEKKDLQIGAVAVPEFGDDVTAYVAEMTADEQDRRMGVPWINRKSRLGQEGNEGFHAFTVAACLCNDKREWLAKTTQEINDLADTMNTLSAKAVLRLFMAADKLNGITGGEVQAIEKN